MAQAVLLITSPSPASPKLNSLTTKRQYSVWLSSWASRVHSADVRIGPCELRAVPVATYRPNSEWPLWWVPLPHIGGLPRQYFAFSVAIDSRTCVAVTSPSRATP